MVSEEANGEIQLCSSDDAGKASVLLVEIGLRELLYKGQLRWQNHSAGRQFSAAFSLRLWARPLGRNGY